MFKTLKAKILIAKEMLASSKKGMTDKINFYIYTVIGIVILFKMLVALMPEAQDAGDCLAATNVPLGSLFSGDGVIFLIIMASVVVGIVRELMKKK